MKVPMNEQIQAVILAVQSYRTFLWNDTYVRNIDESFVDRCTKVAAVSEILLNQVKAYYDALDLPDGMKHNRACFEAVLSYPIDRTLYTEMADLPKQYMFRY